MVVRADFRGRWPGRCRIGGGVNFAVCLALKGSAAKCCVNRLGRGIRGWIQAHQEEAVLDEVVWKEKAPRR